jgi:nucleotide-binding universal stress UspA family protein
MSGFRRILFASDFSPASRPAFAKALDLARALKAELVLTHVIVPVIPVGGPYTARDWDALEKAVKEAAETELVRLAGAARQVKVRVVTVLARGYAADEIVRTAKARRANLIVMGTHGRGGLSRLVMGSAATRVVNGASCPVMTVRAPRAHRRRR